MATETTADVVLLTERSDLAEAVTPLVAAIGLEVRVEPDVESGSRRWLDSSLVLLGEDVAYRGLPGRRPGVVLVGAGEVGDRFWRAALSLGAEHAVVLPRDEQWLLQRLAALADPVDRGGTVVAVVAGAGGAGASTFGASLATSGRDVPAMLVDLDPLGAGVDVLLGGERVPGLRWPDLHQLSGPVRAATLSDALPSIGQTALVAWGSELPRLEPTPDAVESVLDAGRRHHDLVVVDLARMRTPATVAALVHTDVLVLVAPGSVPGALSARALLADLRPLVADVRLVVRTRSTGPRVGPEHVAEAVGLPLYAGLPTERGVAASLERGELTGGRRLRRLCRSLAAELGAGRTEPVRVVA
ncbi:MAG: septum site-determining protein Ssd [Actinomycetes bacterium]